MKVSAVILAGGKSSRMGQKKAKLLLGEESFMDMIIRKLRTLGIEDIIISGYDAADARYPVVNDIYPNKGPLAGIHAGLLAAECDSVLVITEDAPLVPEDFLRQMLKTHEEGDAPVTVAVCGERIQHLPGVYDKKLAPLCEELLQGEKARIMTVIDRAGCNKLAYAGEELLLKGCNTPEEYARVLELTKKVL